VRRWGLIRCLLLAGALEATFGACVAFAADAPASLPLKAPPAPPFTWHGFYLGAHLGYAGGHSAWTAHATATPAPPVSGSIELFNAFDAFKGTGSYFSGFQAGYNHTLSSGFVLGAEADISFPNTISGNRVIFAPVIGHADYFETVQLFGTVRGRFGYTLGHWLIYGTGGVAWSYDQFMRSQLAGTSLDGSAMPASDETSLKVRLGWTAGIGAEVPVAEHWTAKAEYLYAGFGTRNVLFPAAGQRVDSNLTLRTLRFGLNYRPDATKGNEINLPTSPENAIWAIHGQTTYVHQYAFPFRAPYAGAHSLVPNQGRETWDVTLYGGLRLWSGAEVWINPEVDQGFGLSGTLGAAGFTSGEAYKVGASVPYTRIQRYFIRQTVNLGGASEKIEPEPNQFGGSQLENRLVFTAGKLAVPDIFDTNKFAHDPRKDFLNWALINTATFDYAADAWGYTYGAAAEWYQGPWTLRAGLFDLSNVPNSTELDPTFRQFQTILEVERRYELWGQAGKLALTGFLTRGRMGRFDEAVQLANVLGAAAETASVRRYRSRSGISANMEQQIVPEIGMFVRAGIASGDVEPYEFTDVDRTLATGVSISGKLWGRSEDNLSIAGVLNTIASQHKAYFDAGGLGILIGDGKLPNAGPEQIMEVSYSLPVSVARVTFDYQLLINPAYNRDRGPVSVIGTRFRSQF
jgi:high affinity Mn2+ porin